MNARTSFEDFLERDDDHAQPTCERHRKEETPCKPAQNRNKKET
jgi:hypothetical protein